MIKASLRLILAALAATAALTACTKEPTPGKADTDPKAPATEGSRVIAVSFAPQTKTTLDGFQPVFVDGDKILVANGQDEPDTCVVSVKDGKATISTNLTGPLNAVYPAKAAKMNESNPKQIDTVLVSAAQSGTFADANICMAKDITNEAVFENKTAVLRFYVDESIGVTSVKVTSQSEEITPNKGMEITVRTPDGGTLFGLKGNIDQRICYVAIPSGQYTKLTLSSTANTQTPEPRELDNVTLNIGTMYNAFIPYYIQVGEQKWAYCNIGAFLPEEPGSYFSWAEVMGHTPDGNVFTFPESNPDADRYTGSWAASSGFAECNTPYYENSSYKKYNASDNLTGLEAGDDAASVIWGDGWKMPTDTALQVLAGAQRKWDGSKKGYFFGTESCTVFFPVTGYGENNILESEERLGAYWSSVLSSEAIGGKDKAVYLLLKKPNSNAIVPDTFDIVGAGATADTDIYTTSAERRYGLSIRPIYDPAPEVVATDLSSSETANCYIVSAAGVYKFKAVKGNSNESVGTPKSAEVLWESFGTSTAPSVEDLVKNVSLENGYVKFTATDKKGNAVIAVKDENKNILWSWHIWLTDEPEDQVYANDAGTMMDRNLGATSNNGSDAANKLASYGLLYQWGRKDPFPGGEGVELKAQAASTLSWPNVERGSKTVDWAVQNPTRFISGVNPLNDWMTPQNYDLWSSLKTKYDPCPPGYRAPDGGDSGVWEISGFSIAKGGTFSNGFNFSTLSNGTTWYPAAGYRTNNGEFYNMGESCSTWSCTSKDDQTYILYFRKSYLDTKGTNYARAYGLPVRCQKIVEE